jgi:hypothetical protein
MRPPTGWRLNQVITPADEREIKATGNFINASLKSNIFQCFSSRDIHIGEIN